ncbi:hypothetical protein [Kocuria massiliensis]|uniref:hypothetical protein n=1 Tax=Kocuria massiliensis TaxID=1926282 RepID=UPI0022B99564|nr:hypothetical protein [Kocuria massiliensis]
MDKEAVSKPGSDEWWVSRLSKRLSERLNEMKLLQNWLDGEPPIPYPDNDKAGYEKLQRIANVNVAELIVEARLHRMQLLGAMTRVDSSANGDDEVSRLFEEQDLKTKFYRAFWYALGMRHGYLFVDGETGDIRVSGPVNSIVARDPFGKIIAALNIYRDDEFDEDVMVLSRPGYTRTARHGGRTILPQSSTWRFDATFWELGEVVANPESLSDTVLAYELTTGKSLIEKHLPTLARINHTVLQRMILFALQAFRQRALKNAPSTDPSTGQDVDYDGLFESSPDALWLLPEGVEIWESGQADLSPILKATADDLKYLAVTSKTPLYMISPDDANGSAEGASTQRETLTFDVESIIGQLEGEIKRALSDALTVRGESDRADLSQFKLLWANPRRSSTQERANAAQAATNAGVPFQLALSEFAEFTPDLVEEAMQLRSDESFLESVRSAAVTSQQSVQAAPADAGSEVSAPADAEDDSEGS